MLSGLVFPESPRWHDGRLWFSDPYGGRVVRVDDAGEPQTVAAFADDMPSGLGFTPDGVPLVALMRSRKVVAVTGDGVVTHADLSALTPRINDMVVGPDGRAYVGCGAPSEPDSGGVIAIAPDGSFALAQRAIPRPNGLVITPDQGTLIFAASDERVLLAAALDGEGGVGAPREFADLGGRMPDGICLDAEGAVWFGALADGFLRCREGGEILETVVTGDGRLDIACVLGGQDRSTLFMASSMTTFEALAAGQGHTSQGFILTHAASVPGAGWP